MLPILVESFTYLSLGIAIILFRTYTRIQHVGIRKLYIDDYVMLWAIIPYLAMILTGYINGKVSHGFTTCSMTEAQRTSLSPSDPEYRWRFVYLIQGYGGVQLTVEFIQNDRFENWPWWMDCLHHCGLECESRHLRILRSPYRMS